MNSTPISPIRRQSREIITKVIEDSVFGPVQCLPQGDVLDLRKLLRNAYPFGRKAGWDYKVWCEEVRFALGYQIRKTPRYEKLVKRDARHVMPAMREWAKARGILVETPEFEAAFDPADPDEAESAAKVTVELRHVQGGDSWVETFDASDLVEPEEIDLRNPNRTSVVTINGAKKWASNLVRNFNRNLRPGELAREVVSVRFIQAAKAQS